MEVPRHTGLRNHRGSVRSRSTAVRDPHHRSRGDEDKEKDQSRPKSQSSPQRGDPVPKCMPYWGYKHGHLYGHWSESHYGFRHRSVPRFSHLQDVFFQPEGLFSASIPRDCRRDAGSFLLLCGDIESNPGPTPASERRKTKAHVCDNGNCKTGTIRSNQIKAALICKRKGCKRRCHRQQSCSLISKYDSNPEWLCSIHNPNPIPSISFKRPAYSERNTDKPLCVGCKKTITKTPITCGKCEKSFHKTTCSGIIGRETQNQFADNPGSWTCAKCSKKDSQHTETITVLPEVSEQNKGKFKERLRVMQWNACYLKTKLAEVKARLVSDDIDVFLVQETHLTADDLDPHIAGYATYRGKDRTAMKGGGLLAYIKESLKYEKQAKNMRNGTEVCTLRIQLARNSWVQLVNVYCRPANSSGEVVLLDTSLIPVGPNTIICGDFNGHSEIWDLKVQPDDRGEKIEDWMIANDLEPLNDPEKATRFDRHNDNESSPDITFCGKQIAPMCEWEVAEPIGNSDHLPIITTIQVKVPHEFFLGAASRWKRNGVDWSNFTDRTEDVFSKMKPLKNLKERVARLVRTLTDTAKETVGRTKPGKRTKPWLTSDVKSKIKTRNRLRRKIKEKRVEWKAACRAVNEAIEKAKEESWREVLDDVITDADETKLWGIVKSLNGSPASSSRNEAMIHKGKTITSDKRKADIFQQHYASVSRLKFSRQERRSVNMKLKKLLRSRCEGPVESSCRDFSMYELEQAIQSMRKKGAAGPDDIPPSFLKALGPHGRQELLDIINQSWRSAECPQAWLNAIIIPLLKLKKPASDLASYRPISLTSCIAKVMERMVANRLYHLAETSGWIHPSQAGFRKGRSCEDQITRVVQRISDGFNAKPMQRSVMVLLDFSKAYDTVWREKLLLTMAEMGVPLHLIRWLRSFLSNRQARVRFNGVLSLWMAMRQGLPQGSVLAPLLFVFYINTLAKILPIENLNSLFADDVQILASDADRLVATANAQAAVNVVYRWSREWKLNLNASKSEVAYFTNWTGESSWNPDIIINGAPIAYSPTPRLLGVTLDRYLTFAQHVENVCKAATSSCRMLSALSHSKWGWKKQYLVKIYHSVIKSKLGYSGAAWQGNIADSHIQSLERTQNRALRLITGQFKDTPLVALRAEAGIPSYETHMKRNLLISREKALRLDNDHPRRRAFDESVPKRIGMKNDTSHNWCSKTDQLTSKYNLNILSTSRKPLRYFELAPWLDGKLESVFPAVPGLASKHETEILRRTLSYARIRELDSTYVLYSDGSASGGVKQGGAGVVVTFGDPESPTVVDTLMRRGSALTCSYNEEYTAMHLALDWIEEHCTTESRVTVVTDSKSLCDALVGYGHDTKDLRRRLIEVPAEVTIQWVPGHSGIQGNEMADAAAKQATMLPQEPTPITLGSACAKIRATIKDDLSAHERSARVYAKFSLQKEAEVRTREDQVLLGRIRSAHHWCFESYHQLVDETHDTTCKECGWKMHDLEHWLCHCPSTSHIRMRNFGTLDVELEVLTDTPIPALAFTREALGYSQSNAPDVPSP